MDDTTPQQKCSIDLIEQLQHSIDRDSYYLTREDRDRLFYELERFKQKLNDLYRERAHG